MAKQIVYGEDARRLMIEGVNPARQCGEGHPRPEGSQCGAG